MGFISFFQTMLYTMIFSNGNKTNKIYLEYTSEEIVII